MIIVTGEALIDLVLLDGHVAAQPGGGPFNTGGRPSTPESGNGLVSGLLVAEDSFDDFGLLS
jgi:hypothetical protein